MISLIRSNQCDPVAGRRRRSWWWGLCALLVLVRPTLAQRLAEEPWWDRSYEGGSEHYWIKSDLPRADTRAIARHLDIMHGEYSRRLASLPQRAPISELTV